MRPHSGAGRSDPTANERRCVLRGAVRVAGALPGRSALRHLHRAKQIVPALGVPRGRSGGSYSLAFAPRRAARDPLCPGRIPRAGFLDFRTARKSAPVLRRCAALLPDTGLRASTNPRGCTARSSDPAEDPPDLRRYYVPKPPAAPGRAPAHPGILLIRNPSRLRSSFAPRTVFVQDLRG